MLGTVPDITWGVPAADVDREIQMMRDTGIRTVRAHMSWRQFETHGKGQLNQGSLRQLDYAVDRARAAGLDVLVTLVPPVPYWASGDPAKRTDATGERWNVYYKPSRTSDWADFVRIAVERYAAKGVHAYELWNEPNLQRFWPSGVDARDFAPLLEAGAAAVRSADGQAKVVLGGLSKNDYRYLEALYAAGAGDAFDVVAVHPYTGSNHPDLCWNVNGRRSIDALCALEEVRAVMVANGDAAKPVWATEFGYSTSTALWSVDEARQATYTVAALNAMSRYPWLERAYVYAFRNATYLHNDPADWEANLGLVRTDFTPKPALAALRVWAGGGAVTGPVTAPPVPVTVAAADPAPVPTAAPAPVPGADPAIATGGTVAGALARPAPAAVTKTKKKTSCRVLRRAAVKRARARTKRRAVIARAKARACTARRTVAR